MISRAGFATVGIVAVAVLPTMVGLSSARPTGGPPAAKLHWAMARSSLENVSSVDAALAARDFDSLTTLIQSSSPLRSRPTPPGWHSRNTDRWASFAQFATDVREGKLPAYVKFVHYEQRGLVGNPRRRAAAPCR